MTFKTIIKNIFKTLLRPIHSLVIKSKFLKPKVIVIIDGGVASQIYQYLIGKQFADKGYLVEYDLSFFEKDGRDMNGVFERNFDLEKLIDDLKVIEVRKITRFIYRQLYLQRGNYFSQDKNDFSFLEQKPPIYLSGYYRLPLNIWKSLYTDLKFKDDVLSDEDYSKSVEEKIKSCDTSVAIHIRRGDLSEFSPAYGEPVPLNFFLDSIDYCIKHFKNPFFFIFSDEPNWVKENLIEQLEYDDYLIVDENGSDKGYLDLYLLSLCKHQIASKGSFGKIGALLNKNTDKILFVHNDKTEQKWKERHPSVIFI